MRVSRRFAAYRPSFARRLNDESRRRLGRVSVVQLQCVGRRSIAIRASIASALKAASDLISREPTALSRAEGPWPSAVFTIAEQAPVARTNGRGGEGARRAGEVPCEAQASCRALPAAASLKKNTPCSLQRHGES